MEFKHYTGTTVMDTITKTKGIIDGLIIGATGNKRYNMTLIDGKPADGYTIDEEVLEVCEEQIENSLPRINSFVSKFNISDKVVDDSGSKGNIQSIMFFVNGCIKYLIQPKAKKYWIKPEIFVSDEINLKLLKLSEKKEKKPTGGPVSKSIHQL